MDTKRQLCLQCSLLLADTRQNTAGCRFQENLKAGRFALKACWNSQRLNFFFTPIVFYGFKSRIKWPDMATSHFRSWKWICKIFNMTTKQHLTAVFGKYLMCLSTILRHFTRSIVMVLRGKYCSFCTNSYMSRAPARFRIQIQNKNQKYNPCMNKLCKFTFYFAV